MSEFQPHYISDEQIEKELLQPLADRPRPIMPSDYKPLGSKASSKKNV
jgi:hypothetical protein